MYSLNFPNMFNTTTTKIIKDMEATKSNLALVLLSNKKSFIFDPDFGCNLGSLFFDQNDDIIPELVVDQIYTTIQLFIPQLLVNRKDITLEQQKDRVIINIKALNYMTHEIDNYALTLLTSEE